MVVATHEGRTCALTQGLQGEMPVRKKPNEVLIGGVDLARGESACVSVLMVGGDDGWKVVCSIVPGSLKLFKNGERDGRSL